ADSIDCQRPAYNPRIAAQAVLPKRMAEDGDGIGSRLAILMRTERKPERRPDSAGVEKVTGHKLALDRLAHPVATPTHERGFWIESGERRKGLIVVAEVGVAGITQALVPFESGTAFETLQPHLPQFARLRNR